MRALKDRHSGDTVSDPIPTGKWFSGNRNRKRGLTWVPGIKEGAERGSHRKETIAKPYEERRQKKARVLDAD